MREIRPSGSEGGGTNSIASPYPYFNDGASRLRRGLRIDKTIHKITRTDTNNDIKRSKAPSPLRSAGALQMVPTYGRECYWYWIPCRGWGVARASCA